MTSVKGVVVLIDCGESALNGRAGEPDLPQGGAIVDNPYLNPPFWGLERDSMLPPNVTTVTLQYPAYGRSPAGFDRIHAELLPREVGRFVGYDPRTLIMKPKRSTSRSARGTRDLTPHNVSSAIVALQNQVQRSIDTKRVAVMVDYLRRAMETGSFADWGPIELVTSSQPDMSEFEAKHTVYMDADADYFIADGQHRYCAILDFCRENPQYCDRFTQPITISVMPPERLAEWAGQAFHDRNYFAVAVRAGKALAVDARDPVNAIAKQIADHPAIVNAGGIAYERDTLLKGDARFTTHSVLHRFVRGFLFGRSGLDKGVDTRVDVADTEIAALDNYLGILGDVMPWTLAERDQYLARASVVLSALAVVGHDLMRMALPENDLRARLRVLGALDWRRSNLGWVGIVGSEKNGEVQPASSRPAIDATIRFLRERLGIIKPMNGEGE